MYFIIAGRGGISLPHAAMSDPNPQDPLKRFTGLAEIYARCRPDYPGAAIDWILDHCGLKPRSVLVDVGSGTGISTRQFAARGLDVIGIEPNEDMRRQAESEQDHTASIQYRAGRAEGTGLPDASADAIVTAQAFHWFNAEPALREFQRILRPSGWVAVIGNERAENDLATAAYGKIIGATKEAAGVEGPRRKAAEALARSSLFQRAERRLFDHEQWVDEEGLLGRAFSASYAPREKGAAEEFAAQLRRVFAQYQQSGLFRVCYVTAVDVAA